MKISAKQLKEYCTKNNIEKHSLCKILDVSKRTIDRAFVNGLDFVKFEYIKAVNKNGL